MSRRCQLTGKSAISGNNVSHAVNRTRRRFHPNLQNASVVSERLKRRFSLKISTRALRTIEVNGGLDNWLLKTANSKLTQTARSIKRQIERTPTVNT